MVCDEVDKTSQVNLPLNVSNCGSKKEVMNDSLYTRIEMMFGKCFYLKWKHMFLLVPQPSYGAQSMVTKRVIDTESFGKSPFLCSWGFWIWVFPPVSWIT